MDNVRLAAAGGPGKAYMVLTDATQVSNVKLTIDFSALGTIATPSFSDADKTCSISGSIGTCDLGFAGIGGLSFTDPRVILTPGPGATDGATSSLKLIMSADGVPSITKIIPVEVIDGPDFVMSPNQTFAVNRGDPIKYGFTATNVGSEPATDIVANFIMSPGVDLPNFDNCVYNQDALPVIQARCTFPGTVGVNQSYALSVDGHVTTDVGPSVVAIAIIGAGGDNGVYPLSSMKHLNATGVRLTLRKVATPRASTIDINANDNEAFTNWLVKDAVQDRAAIGGSVTGAIGDRVPVTVGVKNTGTTSAYGQPYVVQIPAWAKVTKADAGCTGANKLEFGEFANFGKPGYKYYECGLLTTKQAPGATQNATFTLQVTKGSGADGLVAVDKGDAIGYPDSVASNNEAKITLHLVGGDGALPVTGSKTGLIGGAGAILVLLGAALFYAGRRRNRTAM